MSTVATSSAPIPRTSLSDLVYDRLVAALTSGQYDCGDELNELTLAVQFDVSRTPVREALRRLASEGLVTNSPNRQATVIQLSRPVIRETYEVRQALEAAAAKRAVEHMTADDLVSLRRKATLAVPGEDSAWGEPERRFDDDLHHVIALRCGNDLLRREIGRYLKLVRFVRTRVGRNPQALAQGHQEHEEVLKALESRNPKEAERAMSAHIASALQFVLDDIRWD